MCGLWARNITSYRTLNQAKFRVIHELEKKLPAAPYTREWRYLEADGSGKRHLPFHAVERLVPWVFMAVHFLQTITAFPYYAEVLSTLRWAKHIIQNL